ncbi:MAG: SRPBCC family protein [Deltaproteobacteria bacterium]|nr:SRPBCC family protein [Deltaproteobacteria bacterium]
MAWTIHDGTCALDLAEHIDAPMGTVYDIVADVERYPEFLPDIQGVRMTGDLVEMVYKMGPLDVRVVIRFTWQRPAFIRYTLTEGPLRSLEGEWRFEPEGEGTRVRLSTRFEPNAAGRWLLRMTQRMIEQKTEALLAAFRERFAEASRGPASDKGGQP